MVGMSTCGLLFLSTFVANTIMHQFILRNTARASHSLTMGRYLYSRDICCAIVTTWLTCLQDVVESAAARCDLCRKSISLQLLRTDWEWFQSTQRWYRIMFIFFSFMVRSEYWCLTFGLEWFFIHCIWECNFFNFLVQRPESSMKNCTKTRTQSLQKTESIIEIRFREERK